MNIFQNVIIIIMFAVVVGIGMDAFADSLPPTIEELNCNISTPLCRDGQYIGTIN